MKDFALMARNKIKDLRINICRQRAIVNSLSDEFYNLTGLRKIELSCENFGSAKSIDIQAQKLLKRINSANAVLNHLKYDKEMLGKALVKYNSFQGKGVLELTKLYMEILPHLISSYYDTSKSTLNEF